MKNPVLATELLHTGMLRRFSCEKPSKQTAEKEKNRDPIYFPKIIERLKRNRVSSNSLHAKTYQVCAKFSCSSLAPPMRPAASLVFASAAGAKLVGHQFLVIAL